MSAAAELIVAVRATGVSSAIGGLNQVDAAGRRVESSIKSSMKQIAGPLGLASIGIAAAAAGREMVGFDRSMRNVNSIAGLSEGQFKKLRKSVTQLAGTTAQGPTTLANGLYDLVSSGFDASESMLILKSSSKAATAGLTDTATSTKAVAAILNAYKRPASDAAQVSDDLFQTVNRGVLSFSDLAQNIGDVLPWATNLGVGLKQVGAGISTMTKQGEVPAEAFTKMKGAMVALVKPSDAMKAALQKLGVATGEDLVKKSGSLQGALQRLRETTGGNKEAFQKLFPDVRGAAAALELTGKNARSAKQDLDAFGNTKGATNTAFEEQAKSISFQWDRAKSSIQGAIDSIDTGGAVKALTGMSNALDALSGKTDTIKANGAGGGNGNFFGGMVGDMREILGTGSAVLGLFSGIAGAAADLGYGLQGLPGAGGAFRALGENAAAARDKIDGARRKMEELGGLRLSPKQIAVIAQTGSAKSKIKELVSLGVPPKVARVLVSTDSAKSKIKALTSLGIPVKYAKILVKGAAEGAAQAKAAFGKVPAKKEVKISAGVSQALAGIASVKGALGSLPASKTVTVTTVTKKVKGDAAGRGPGRSEVALVGEGGGPEWVGNTRDGWGMVTGPTLMALGSQDYVIPTEPKYRGRWAAMAKEMGVPGFAKGKGPSKKEQARRQRVDQRISDAGTSAQTFQTRGDIAQDDQNPGGFYAAKKARIARLRLQRKRILGELRRAKGSRRVALLNQLAQVNRDLQQAGDQSYEAPTVETMGKSGDVLLPRESNYAGNFGKVDPFAADLALAGLTADKGDDKAVLERKKKYLEAALGGAKASGDQGAITAVATELKSTMDALDSTIQDNTATMQAQLDVQRAQLDETRKALGTSQAELRAFGKWVVGRMNGEIGQGVGRTASTPVPGVMAGY